MGNIHVGHRQTSQIVNVFACCELLGIVALDEERGLLTTAPSSEKGIAPIVLLLLVITFTAGMVDAVSVLGLGGVFTSLMTGNVVNFDAHRNWS